MRAREKSIPLQLLQARGSRALLVVGVDCLEGKLLIIDRELAFTGGMNIADEYHLDRPEEPAWRDTHLCVRGEVAQDLAALFAESWEAAGGQPLRFASRPQAQPGGTPLCIGNCLPAPWLVAGQRDQTAHICPSTNSRRSSTRSCSSSVSAPGLREAPGREAVGAAGVAAQEA